MGIGDCLEHSGVLRAETSPLLPVGTYCVHSHPTPVNSMSLVACSSANQETQSWSSRFRSGTSATVQEGWTP